MKRRLVSFLLSITMIMAPITAYAQETEEFIVVEDKQQEFIAPENSEEYLEITIVELPDENEQISGIQDVEIEKQTLQVTLQEKQPEETTPEKEQLEEEAPEEEQIEEVAPEEEQLEEEAPGNEPIEETTSADNACQEAEVVKEDSEGANIMLIPSGTEEVLTGIEDLENAFDGHQEANAEIDNVVVQGSSILSQNNLGNNLNSYAEAIENTGDKDTYTKSIENFSTSKSSTGRYNANFTIIEKNDKTGVEKKYLYTVSGFANEARAREYVDTICEKTDQTADVIICIKQDDLIDAEKKPWGQKEGEEEGQPFDSNLCWAGSASDMLMLSGWNKADLLNSYGKDVSTEDRLFDHFANNFTDDPGNQIYGINWFFTGVNIPQYDDGWSHLKSEDGYTDSFLREYCVEDFTYSERNIGESNLGEILKKLDYDEDGDRCAIGLVFGYYEQENNRVVRNGGHCVTIVGYSTDENGVPNTITIADSDSYNSDGKVIYSKDNNREDYYNVYSTYPIEYYDGNWHLMNFSYPDNILDDLIVLKYYSDNTKNKLEQGGTLDLVNYLDYTIEYERTFTTNYRDIVDTVYQGDVLNAGFELFEKSVCENYYAQSIPYRIIVSKDGMVIRTVNDVLELSDEDESGSGYFFYNMIMDENTPLEPGEYSVSFVVNYDRSFEEAYYNNNKSRKDVRFIVLKRVDKNGETSYIVVPDSYEEKHSDDEQSIVTKFLQKVVDFSAVTESSYYIDNPQKTFEFHLSNGISDMNLSDNDIANADIVYDYSDIGVPGSVKSGWDNVINAKISVTKDDFKIIRNLDGTISIIFSNKFMRKLPKGIHYFKMRIDGKVQTFKLEVK